MEGVFGVTRWEERDSSHQEFTRFRRIMIDEVSAAIAGAADVGADEFVVADGNSNGTNILIEELDSRARLNSGGVLPLSMLQGVDSETAGMLFMTVGILV